MQVVNWLAFKPSDVDIKALTRESGQAVHVRLLVRDMVRGCLSAYPWQGRVDLVPLFDPSQAYQAGQAVALPRVDAQGVRPDSWRVGTVKSVDAGENPLQGRFQIVTVKVDGKEQSLASGLEQGEPFTIRIPTDSEELDMLVDDLVNHYLDSLSSIINELINQGQVNALRQGEQILFGKVVAIQTDLKLLFIDLPASKPYLTADDIILKLWDAGELTDSPEKLSRVLVEQALGAAGYQDKGGGRWMTPEKLAVIDRQLSLHLVVPRNRSKIKAQLGKMEELDADDFIDLPERAQAFLQELNVEGDTEDALPNPETWSPPTDPLKMPALSYLHIMQGYFPLTGTLARAFPPTETSSLVDVTLVEGDPFLFVVNLKERRLKSVDPQGVYTRLVRELGIPAGTFLWLEYHGQHQYRIAPHPLAEPKMVHCKQAWLENGLLHVEENEIKMPFEGDEHLFKAELRFEDIEALFSEAEECDCSIFDAIYDVLPKLAALRPDGLVHYNDIFNAVFFEYRMCSYRTVIHELYDHACFAEAGDGFYRFAPELGVSRRRPTRHQVADDFWREQPQVVNMRAPATPVEAEFWRQIANDIPRQLETLDEHKPFEITSVTHETIELVVSTGQPRTLPRADIEQAWNELTQRRRIARDRVTELAEFNVAYVMAILAQLPGVSYKLRPLQLTMVAKPDLSNESAKVEVTTEEEKNIDDESLAKVIRGEKTRSGQIVAPDLLPLEPLFSVQGLSTADGTSGMTVQPPEQNPPEAPTESPVESESAKEVETIPGKQEIYKPGYPKTRKELVEFLNKLVGKEILLQRYAYPMEIISVGYNNVRFSYGNYNFGGISVDQVFAAWQTLKKQKTLTQSDLEEFSGWYKTYLFAIIQSFPNVSTSKWSRSYHLRYQMTRKRSKPLHTTSELMTEIYVEGNPEHGEVTPEKVSMGEIAVEQDPIVRPAKASSFSRKGHANAPRGDEMQSKTLFSNNFMKVRLEGMPEWNEDCSAALAQICRLWQTAARLGMNWNEAQTEDEFIKPVLEVLGWSYVVQAKSGRSGQVTRPDYALFADEAAKHDAYPFQGNDEAFYSRALAIAEAKHWDRPLSQKDSSGRATWKAESNPSHQMVNYLVGTRAEWGILTNGRTWRLYSREVSSTASEYYEVDLGNLFDFLPENVEASPAQMDEFKRWWLFFRREAFSVRVGGKSFVQRVHEGSALYAREISDKLKELVFQEVMPEIAGGFVAYRRQQKGIAEETPESLQEIYRASLSLLYKLLFLLYAEARSLLPMENPDYRVNSLTAIAEWAAEQIDARRSLSTATYATPHYEGLLALFRRIDRGDPALGIPEYNGGLFSPKNEANIFLEHHTLSDQAVARAVDILVRDASQPVDYAFISVRNLGAIYQGLLENKLQVVDAAAGKVELINDKGERKATGSYYTPDYIVEYIVRNTLDPILDKRQQDYADGMEKVTSLRKQLLRVSNASTAARLRGELEDAERAAREAFLGIKVLDPAMGSGHFLVNAVDHLTDGIIQRMQTWHDAHLDSPWDWDPIQQLIEKVRREIRQELEHNALPVDGRLSDDTALLMRLVMKRCIYGVDLNEMAVELARVSLWLHTFTVGAPLSFLDHHLRWGNSLIGTDVRTVENNIRIKTREVRISKSARKLAQGRGEIARESEMAMQSRLFGGPFAGLLDLTAVMIEVAERADATLSDVRESAAQFDSLQKALIPYKQALNLWVSQYFGNTHAGNFMELYGDDVLPAIRGEREVGAQYKTAMDEAQRQWEKKRFFHWDLEFPEVFVDLRKRDWAQNGGFDVVIGNPPYDELSEVALGRTIDEKDFFEKSELYKDAVTYRVNLYRLFIACAVSKTANTGSQGFIVPMSLLGDRFTFELRKWLLETNSFQVIDAFPQKDDPRNRVFEDAKLPTCVYVLTRGKSDEKFRVHIHPGKELLENSPSYYATSRDIETFDVENWTIPVLGEKEWSLAQKLTLDPKLGRLGDIARPMSGEVVFNEQFRKYLSEDPSKTLVLRGGHVQRYELLDDPKQGSPIYIDIQKWMNSAKEGSSAFAHKKSSVNYFL
jgi:hypothetical protein